MSVSVQFSQLRAGSHKEFASFSATNVIRISAMITSVLKSASYQIIAALSARGNT